MVAIESNRKSYVAYGIAQFSTALNDIEGHIFAV